MVFEILSNLAASLDQITGIEGSAGVSTVSMDLLRSIL